MPQRSLRSATRTKSSASIPPTFPVSRRCATRDAPPVQLAPFFDVDAFTSDSRADVAVEALSATLDLPRDSPRLIAVAMMRRGNKLASYRALACGARRDSRIVRGIS